MNTVFLSDETVSAYLRDLLARLVGLGPEAPEVWCPIGPSGGSVCQAMMRLASEHPTAFGFVHSVPCVALGCDRNTDEISFPTDPDPAASIRAKRVLLVDGTIHSGKTFQLAYRAVEALGAASICTYSLVVRSGASVLPSFFALIVGDHDRAMFPRALYPNNKLAPTGCLRKLCEEDQERPPVHCGRRFIDKFSWSDMLYEARVDPHRSTYLFEDSGTIQGFVSFRLLPRAEVLVDTLAVDQAFQNLGLAGHLMRWAETCARQADCDAVTLWAVEDQRRRYEHWGFSPGGQRIILDGERFLLMGKKVLYNLSNDLGDPAVAPR